VKPEYCPICVEGALHGSEVYSIRVDTQSDPAFEGIPRHHKRNLHRSNTLNSSDPILFGAPLRKKRILDEPFLLFFFYFYASEGNVSDVNRANS
jgi:hypothetical protein